MNATTDKSTDKANAAREPAELEREASEIRADLDRTLDALERKLSPSQLLDRSLDYLREHGGELTRNVSDVVQRNPVPILMAVAGVTWLVASTLRSDSTARGHTRDDTFGDESPYADTPDRVSATRERIRRSRAAAADKLAQAADATREQTRIAQDRLQSMVIERPLLLGGIAVAIGALVGALIPPTQYEDRTVGQVRDRAVRRAKQMGERQYANLRSKLETHQGIEVSGQAH
jgi:ElaB/YqjD/DUF883 family membrane-anchored ribosome-binding protein